MRGIEFGRRIKGAIIGTQVEGTVVAVSPHSEKKLIVQTNDGYVEVQKPYVRTVFVVGSIIPIPPLADLTPQTFDRGSRVNQRFFCVRPFENGKRVNS